MNETLPVRPDPRRNILLVTVLINAFVVPFLVSSVNVGLPVIGSGLHIAASRLGWIISVYLISLLLVLVPFGRLADFTGPGRVFFAGGVIYTVGSLLCGFAFDFWSLLAFRVVQAAGAGMQLATGNALLVSSFPASERGKVLGLNVAVVYAGLAAGPFLGGWIVHILSWQALFFLNVPLGLTVSLLSFSFINMGARGPEDIRPAGFDLKGTVFYAIAVICLGLGLPIIIHPAGILLFCAGAAFFILLLRAPPGRAPAVIDLSLFRENRTFAFSSFAALINYGATYSLGFLLNLYLQYVKGLPPGHAGLVLVIQPVIQAVIAPVSGRLSDRHEPRLLATAGMALTALGLALLIGLTPSTPMSLIIGVMVILGIGFGLFSAPNTNAIMGSVTRNHLGSASALVSTMRLAGQLFSMAILILISSILMAGKPVIPENFPAFMASLRISFIIFAFLCCVGIYFSSARGVLHAPASGPGNPE